MDDLISKARDGDDEAFCNLMLKKKDVLYRMAFAYSKNHEDAMDIVNDCIIKAYTSIRSLRNPHGFKTWLTRILTSCAMNFMKKNKRAIPIDENILIDTAIKESLQDEVIDLYNAIDGLRDKYKTVIILKYFEDMPLSEISEVLQCPVGTVKTYIYRALKELRIELEEVEEWETARLI